MEPQLERGDRVVVSKLAYRLHEPRRGDVIVFDSPNESDDDEGSFPRRALRELAVGLGVARPSEEELIKRVIGLPGETVEGRDGRLYIDGRELIEPYLPPGTSTAPFAPVTVPEDQLWVMGDNRGSSSDSRVFGPIQRDSIVGRAIARVWPPGRTAFL
ncbi:hypothetical protein BH18ACT4_BH18ACT4_08920 [soil metagenome]